MSDLQARASCCITQSVTWRKLFAVGQAVRPAHIGMLRAITARDIPRRRAFRSGLPKVGVGRYRSWCGAHADCPSSCWYGSDRTDSHLQDRVRPPDCPRSQTRSRHILHPKLNRVMDDPRDWPCAKARLYAQSPMSSYPRRTFALRPGRDASHDRYTSTAVPLDDRHVLTLISLEHHELTPWIRLGTGSLDARRRRRRPKSRTTSSSDEAADPEPIDQRRDPGRLNAQGPWPIRSCNSHTKSDACA